MSEPITQAERDLVELIRREGGEPWLRLAAKCDYEEMIPAAVIREWGDPRTWHGIPFIESPVTDPTASSPEAKGCHGEPSCLCPLCVGRWMSVAMRTPDALIRKGVLQSPLPQETRMPSRFRKKPVVIEAVVWTGENLREVIAFTGRHESARDWTWEHFEEVVRRDGLIIFTLEGKHLATVGDSIIKGVKGEFYPCKSDIFAATYEPVEDVPAPITPTGDHLNDR